MAKEYATVVGGTGLVGSLTARYLQKIDFDESLLSLFLFGRRYSTPQLKRNPEHPELNARFGGVRYARDRADVVEEVCRDGLVGGETPSLDEDKFCLATIANSKPQVDAYNHQTVMLRLAPSRKAEEAEPFHILSNKVLPYFSWFVATAGPSMLAD